MTAIILVNYQSYADTVECIQSILTSSAGDYEIFVVDNSRNKAYQHILLNSLASWKDNKSFSYHIVEANDFNIHNHESQVTIINAENKGFAAANNIVLKQLKGHPNYEFIWLLNNDTIIAADTLEKYIAEFKKTGSFKKLGMLGCVLRYEDKPSVIQGTGGVYYKFLGTSAHVLDGQDMAAYDPGMKHHIDYPIGASMLVSSAFLNDTGLMNESYFLYFEELDWVVRGRKKGWVCDYASEVYILHKAGKTIGGKNKLKPKSSNISDYYFYRNRMRFSLRYTPFHFPFVMLTVLASIGYRILRGRSAFLRLFINKKERSG